MIGSLWTGILGLNAQQKALENESNNIANVNTVGYKSSRVNFSEQLYASGLGHGASVENYQKDFKQGSIKTTGRQYDMSLQGDGFFVIKSDNQGSGNYFRSEKTYTRAGNFDISTDGYLSTPEGFEVQGWTSVTSLDKGASTTNTDTMFTEGYEYLVYNHIDRDTTKDTITTEITRRSLYGDNATANQQIEAERALNHYSEAPHGGLVNIPSTGSSAVSFDVDGTTYPATALTGTTQTDVYAELKSELNTAGYIVGDMLSDGSFSVKKFDVDTEVVVAGTNGLDSYENAVAKVEAAGAKLLQSVTVVSNNGIVHNSLDLDLTRMNISDNPLGEFSVNENGEISIYQGGADVVIGQVAIAKFTANSGLEPIGKNLFRKTIQSGDALYATNNSKMATLEGKSVEVSNADLSESLINMIVYQRAFEANAKTITTSDELLTTIMGIKR
jgi:flagellar hook protein FlgE